MQSCRRDSVEGHCRRGQTDHRSAGIRDWLRRWFLLNTLLSGALALLWLLLRSGNKPSRFAYPCQQAAFGTATAAFGAPLVATVLSARRGIASALATPSGRLLATCGLVVTLAFGAWGLSPGPSGYKPGAHQEPRGGYRAQVYHVTRCPEDPVGDRFVGLDTLITLMGAGGLRFYQSETIENFETGPDGIIGAEDVVVIKINYQWPERGGTNTDLLSGLIRRIVDHPDTFVGEIVVCENAQFNSINGFDRSYNNAQDWGHSPHDVVVGFQQLGYNISHYDWTVRRYTQVDEYSERDMGDGYVVYDYDSQIHGRVSYPKFRSADGTYISLKYGIWDPVQETYDREHLKFINVPVLKSHHATYGATACVKHYMGVVTGELGTSSHSGIYYGLLGAVIGEIQVADLNILDAIWVQPNPYDGPWCEYDEALRMDELVASVDPVAADIWSVKHILIPAFIREGYSPPWPYPSADPDLPNSSFRIYLDNSMDQILAAGYDVTNDFDLIDAHSWHGNPGAPGDINLDGQVNGPDIASFVSAFLGTNPEPLELLASDMDGDLDVDEDDIPLFVGILVETE